MTKLDPTLPMSLARERQFYAIIKTSCTSPKDRIKRSMVNKLMNCSMATFQHEYSGYLQSYPQIIYYKQTREFSFEP